MDEPWVSSGSVDFSASYYIKLGQGGAWEADCIEMGRLRIGWLDTALEDIRERRWDVIEKQLRTQHQARPRGTATADLNALRRITESSPDDVWVTFHKTKLWWTRLASSPFEEDEQSKFRRTGQPWSDRDVNGKLLVSNDLPGQLAQIQGFRGTLCRVNSPDVLHRVLNGIRSPAAITIGEQRASLSRHIGEAVKHLHWKDFETLVDLVFRATGWERISVLGQHAKAYDLELREPITGDRYVVQVKSRADLDDVLKTASAFSPDDYRLVFFVIHSPSGNLAGAREIPEHVQLVPPERLGELVVDRGLVKWVEDKVS